MTLSIKCVEYMDKVDSCAEYGNVRCCAVSLIDFGMYG